MSYIYAPSAGGGDENPTKEPGAKQGPEPREGLVTFNAA